MDIGDYIKVFLPPALIFISLIGSIFKIRRSINNEPVSKFTVWGYIVIVLGILGITFQTILSYKEVYNSKEDKKFLSLKLDSLRIISVNAASTQDSLIDLNMSLQNDIINLQKNQILLDSLKRAEYIDYLLSSVEIELALNLEFIDEIDRNNISSYINSNTFLTGHFEYSLLNEALHLDIDNKVKRIILITIQMMKTGNQLIDQIIQCGNCPSKGDNINYFIDQKNDIRKNLKYIQYRFRFTNTL